MATLNGNYWTFHTIKAEGFDPIQVGLLLFNVSGTYAQADNATILDVPSLIRNARKSGRAVTLLAASIGQLAEKQSDRGKFMGLKTITIDGDNIDFEITDSNVVGATDLTTELANGAVPPQSSPFGLLVTFTEA